MDDQQQRSIDLQQMREYQQYLTPATMQATFDALYLRYSDVFDRRASWEAGYAREGGRDSMLGYEPEWNALTEEEGQYYVACVVLLQALAPPAESAPAQEGE